MYFGGMVGATIQIAHTMDTGSEKRFAASRAMMPTLGTTETSAAIPHTSLLVSLATIRPHPGWMNMD